MKAVFSGVVMNEVVAIVVTYNRKDLLMQCVEKLKKQTFSLDILIIDNASTDGTNELFNDSEKYIKYFNTGSNLGGAGGFSFGIKKAVELGYDYLWILDDDTMATPTALEMFWNEHKKLNGKYGFLTSKVLWKDDSICTMNIQKESKWKQLKDFESIHTVQYASFVSLFIKATTVRKVGLPYKEFFIWADDWEYTRRISKEKKCYYVPQSIVHHWCNTNVGANIITAEPDRMERFKYMYRNDVVMYRQDGIEGSTYLFVRNMLHRIRILKDGKNVRQKIELIKMATREGKSFYPSIEFPRGE